MKLFTIILFAVTYILMIALPRKPLLKRGIELLIPQRYRQTLTIANILLSTLYYLADVMLSL